MTSIGELDRVTQRFASTDRETRLQLLLHNAKKLPPLPERFAEARDRGENKVHECQTPVFLYTELVDGKAHLYADAAPESPTVRGFVSVLGSAINGATPAEVAAVPDDLLDRLGLSELLGMTRMQGLTAVLGRVKRMVRDLATAKAT
jgi:cysteine desulfuration protein SufE